MLAGIKATQETCISLGVSPYEIQYELTPRQMLLRIENHPMVVIGNALGKNEDVNPKTPNGVTKLRKDMTEEDKEQLNDQYENFKKNLKLMKR